jgi:hypothetical protein
MAAINGDEGYNDSLLHCQSLQKEAHGISLDSSTILVHSVILSNLVY